MLFDEFDVIAAVFRKIFVLFDATDVAFPSWKSFENRLTNPS